MNDDQKTAVIMWTAFNAAGLYFGRPWAIWRNIMGKNTGMTKKLIDKISGKPKKKVDDSVEELSKKMAKVDPPKLKAWKGETVNVKGSGTYKKSPGGILFKDDYEMVAEEMSDQDYQKIVQGIDFTKKSQFNVEKLWATPPKKIKKDYSKMSDQQLQQYFQSAEGQNELAQLLNAPGKKQAPSMSDMGPMA